MTTLASMSWEERAHAAERTVAVLKRKMQALYDGDATSAIERQLEEIKRRFETIDGRRELSELRAFELEGHKRRLEREVAERAKAIRTIADNVTFGFLLVDRSGVVLPGATRSSLRLFGGDVTARRLAEVLGLDSGATGRLEVAMEQVFDDILPEEVSLALVPSRFAIGTRILALEGGVVRAEDGTVESLLFSVSDVTAFEESTREAELNRSLVQILRQRGAFARFLEDAGVAIDACSAMLGDQPEVRRAVHTIKGNAGCFGLGEVVDACHEIEDAVVIDRAALERIRSTLDGFVARHAAILGSAGSEDDAPRLPEETLVELAALATRSGSAELDAFVRRLRLRPASEVLEPLASMVEQFARAAGKGVELVSCGLPVLVDVDRYREVFSRVTHLVRNAIDHGIETPSERGDKGPRGRLELSVTEEPDAWRIVVRDDGRGIDVEGVRARAVESGALTEDAAARLARHDVLALCLLDGVSTVESASAISGRGVGMAAVVAAVARVGGTLRLESEVGKGTTVCIDLPRRSGASP